MSDEIKRLMNSPYVDDRKQAVRKLAETRDTSALTYLSILYRTDTDEEVRELALKAGRFIKQNSNLSALSTQEVMAAPIMGSAYDSPTPQAEVSAEEEQQLTRKQQAEALMVSAKDHFDDRNRVEARKITAEAFTLYPDFEKDIYYVELLGQIMEVRTEYALSELADYRRGGYERRKRRRERQSLDDTPLARALFFIAIIAVVAIGGAMAVYVGVGELMASQLTQTATVTGADPVRGTFLQASMGVFIQFMNYSAQGIAVNASRGFVTGLSIFLTLMVAYFIISVASKSFFDGDGTFGGLVRATYKFIVIGLVVLYGGFAVLTYLYLSPILEGLYRTLTLTQPGPYEDAIQNAAPIGGILALFVVGVFVLFSVPMARGIARNYRLSAQNGFSTVMLATVAVAFSGCGLLISLAPLAASGAIFTVP